MTTQSELFRARLDEEGITYETSDNKNNSQTYGRITLNGEAFEFDFYEPFDGRPGTIGAMREFSFSSVGNITPEEAVDVLCEVMDS